MRVLTLEEKTSFRAIARLYGCKIKFVETHSGGFWGGDYIQISTKAKTFNRIASVFFHELAHYRNWKESRFPLYHNPKNFKAWHKHFKTPAQRARYALRAEMFTEARGAELMKQWFPNMKYRGYYKNSKECFGFLYGYYYC